VVPAAPAPTPAPAAAPAGPAGPATVESVKKDLETLRAQWLELVPPPQGLKPDQPTPTHLVAHDLTVKPGATYRYRVQVALLDPYFMKAQLPEKEKRKYFKMLALVSKPATTPEMWSPPVTVSRPSQFFLSKVESQSATFVVRYIHAGDWKRAEFSFRRGRAIAGQVSADNVTTALRSGEFLVDALPEAKRVVLRDAADHLRSLVVDDDQDNLTRFNALANLGVGPAPSKGP
jgi:hypothetical protein